MGPLDVAAPLTAGGLASWPVGVTSGYFYFYSSDGRQNVASVCRPISFMFQPSAPPHPSPSFRPSRVVRRAACTHTHGCTCTAQLNLSPRTNRPHPAGATSVDRLMNNPSSGGESHPGGAAAGGSSKWESHLLELIVFKGKHGHLNVPRKYPDDQPLAGFVHYVRKRKALGKLSSQWERRLTGLGFDFYPWETEWMGKYHQVAVIFDLKRNSGKRATITKAENKSLNKWLSNQRQEYKKLERGVQSSMTSKRIDLLEHVGMNLKVRVHAGVLFISFISTRSNNTSIIVVHM